MQPDPVSPSWPERVSNAVRYGRPPIELTIERTTSDWRIDVADAGAHRRGRPTQVEDGRGLRIVGALAESWGVADDALRVWCRLGPASDRSLEQLRVVARN